MNRPDKYMDGWIDGRVIDNEWINGLMNDPLVHRWMD